MKNLKKLFAIALALIVTLTFTGCGNKTKKSGITPKEAFEKSREATAEVSNYKLNMKMEVGMAASGMQIDMSVVGDATLDLKNKTAYMKISANALGQTSETESYISYDDTKTITYTKLLTGWAKETGIASNIDTLSIVEDFGKDYEIKELAADEKNYNYEITIKKEDMNILLAANGGAGMEDTLTSINSDVKVKVSLDKETYKISKMSMDLLDILKDVNIQGVTYTKAIFEFEFSDFDKAGEVNIPEEAINNAIETSSTEI